MWRLKWPHAIHGQPVWLADELGLTSLALLPFPLESLDSKNLAARIF